MLDAPFSSLEADYHAALERRDRAGPRPARRARGPRARGLVLALLRAYKLLISPLFTGCCRFHPSCSDYMAEAVRTHGSVRGSWLGLRRLVTLPPVRRPRVRSGAAARTSARSLMERRVLLAVVLSFLVLYAYQALFVPPPPPPSQQIQQTRSSEPRAAAAPAASAPATAAPPSRDVPAARCADDRGVRARDRRRDGDRAGGVHEPRRRASCTGG